MHISLLNHLFLFFFLSPIIILKGLLITHMFHKVTREQFLSSSFLSVKLLDLEKNFLHRNRFVFQIVTDKVTEKCRKKYSELKQFATELNQKMGMQQFVLQHRMRSSEQFKELEIFFKKLSSGYLMSKEGVEFQKKQQLRNFVYNLFFSEIDSALSDQEETKEETRKMSIGDQSDKLNQTEIFQDRDKKEHKRFLQKTDNHQYLKKIKGIYKRKNPQSESKAIFQQTMWIKSGQKWQKKHIELTQKLLIVSEQARSPKTMYLMKKYEVILAEDNYRRIQFNHHLLEHPIQLRLRDITEQDKDSDDLQEYIWIMTKIKQTTLAISHYEEEVVNFVLIKLSNKKNKFSQENQKRPTKQLLFKLTHENEVIEFSIPVDRAVYLQMPITNSYGKIEGEVIEGKEGGIIHNLHQNSICFSIPIQSIYDIFYNSKPKRKNNEIRFFLLSSKLSNYSIKIDYFQKANRWSYCSFRNEDRFEGEKEPTQFSRDEFRIQKNRFKRVLYTVQSYVGWLRSLTNMKYPYQSYLFYTLLCLLVLLFDGNYLLHYFIATMASLIIYNHPSFQSYTREIILILGLTEYMKEIELKMKQKSKDMSKVHFKVDIEKKNFIEQFRFTRKKGGSIKQKYNRFQLMLLRGQLLVTQLVTLSQKIKNIFVWYHHRKTKQILLLLLAILTILIFLPIRLFMLVVIFKMFKKGLTHNLRTKELNKVILFQIFQKLMEENNFGQAKAWMLNRNMPYNRQSSDYIHFQRRIREWMSLNLGVQIQNQLFTESRCMNELISSLADCQKRFVIPLTICQKYSFNREWASSGNTVSRLLLILYGFILNIPSDRNIIGISHQDAVLEGEVDSDDLESP